MLAVGLMAGGLACATASLEVPEPPPVEELYAQGLEILQGRSFLIWRYVDYDAAIHTFQEVIDNYPYSDYAVQSELRIADAYFDDGRYEEALSYYRDFPELHPKNERAPYALLRAALCHYERVRAPNRDQEPTRKALAQLDHLISRFPGTPEAERAEVLRRELRERLGRSVLGIAGFYMGRGEWQSAANRFRQLLDEFPGLGFDAEALYELGVCYRRLGLEDEAERVFQVLLDEYRGTDLADSAADLIAAAN